MTEALEGFPLTAKYCWLDSTVALYLIKSPGEYKQFVSNRVQKIQSLSEVIWQHVGTTENPADVGSRSGEVSNHPLWWKGPQWLQQRVRWPPDIVPSACQETLAEAKAIRDVFAVAIAETDELDTLLEKFSYWKVMRICAWITRFIRNARSAKMRKLTGPLTTEETNKANVFWVKRVQTRAPLDKYY